MSASAFVLVDAILPIGNHTISEYLRTKQERINHELGALLDELEPALDPYGRRP